MYRRAAQYYTILLHRDNDMNCSKQIIRLLLCGACVLLSMVSAAPDSEYVPEPAPGIAYGGIPYGSMSGNVAEYERLRATSGGRSANIDINNLRYKPIEQWLR